jgi:murein L,D-transpeptidase YcbB/YkuD
MESVKMGKLLIRLSPRHLALLACLTGLIIVGIDFNSNENELPVFPAIKKIINSVSDDSLNVQGIITHESLLNKAVLQKFYNENNYVGLWISKEGKLNPIAWIWITRIKQSYLEGLNPNDYHITEITTLLSNIKDGLHTNKIMDNYALIELLLTDAFITFAHHHYAGRVHTKDINTEWLTHITEINPIDSVKNLAQGANIQLMLDSWACPHKPYRLLQNQLKQCYLKPDSTNKKNIRLIALNMERWRWLPRSMSDTYIMANSAGFELWVRLGDKDTLNMKIVTGMLNQPTPIISSKMTYIVFNPSWDVPYSIATKEMLPKIKNDHKYLGENHLKIYNQSGQRIIPNSISWGKVTSSNFPYRIKQTPGPWNALGQIKFVFPNAYSIYLHDTPQKLLFEKSVRTFSHGCIRIEKPHELAAYLIGKDTTWITNKLKTKKEQMVKVLHSPPIYICYWTAWISEDGDLRKTPDVYQYDRDLEFLLNEVTQINKMITTLR